MGDKMIQDLIDKSLADKQEQRATRQRSGMWSPSSFGKCYRAQFWNRKNEPQTNPPDARTLRVFAAGQLFHDFVQGFLPSGQCEVKVTAPDIFGYADYVTDDTVYDFKSQHSRAFWYMNKDGYDITSEKETNILQVVSYAFLLNKPKATLVFISKDDLCIKDYTFITEKYKQDISEELKTLRKYWQLNELPPAEPRAYNGKECKYCNFRDKCKELEG